MLFYTVSNPIGKNENEFLGSDQEFHKDLTKAYKLLNRRNADTYLKRAVQHHPEKANLFIQPHESSNKNIEPVYEGIEVQGG